jgi:hypothetical protein
MELFKYTSNALTVQAWNRRMSIGCFILGACVGAAFCALFLQVKLILTRTSASLVDQRKRQGAHLNDQNPANIILLMAKCRNLAELSLRTRFGDKR